MTVDDLKTVLLWSTLLNYGVLLVWFGAFVFAHDLLLRTHGRWFKLSRESFDAFNYGGVGLYKLGILLLNVVPLIALHIAS